MARRDACATPFAYVDDAGTLHLLPSVPPVWELHIGATRDFTSRGWGRKVRDAGGRYTEARGDALRRIVLVPSDAAELINDIVRRFGQGNLVAIAREVPQLPVNARVLKCQSAAGWRAPAATLALRWCRNLARLASDPGVRVVVWDERAQQALEARQQAEARQRAGQAVAGAACQLVQLLVQLPKGQRREVLRAVQAAAKADGAQLDVCLCACQALILESMGVPPGPGASDGRRDI